MLGSVVAVVMVVAGKPAVRVAGAVVGMITLLLCAPTIAGHMHAARTRSESDVARSSLFIVSKLRQFGFDERAGTVPDHSVAHA